MIDRVKTNEVTKCKISNGDIAVREDGVFEYIPREREESDVEKVRRVFLKEIARAFQVPERYLKGVR